MGRRRAGVVIEEPPADDQHLFIVRVEPGCVVLSTGEELCIRYEKLQALAEQICQERVPVKVRTWWTKAGMELVELHRA